MSRNIVIGLAGALLTVVAVSPLAPRATFAGGGTCYEGAGAPVLDERTTIVVMSNNCMVPTIARVDAGATVTWVNEDDAAHTVDGANFAWGDGTELPRGGEVAQTFEADGVYPYFCVIHPGMVGVVVAGDGNATGAATQDAVIATSLLSRETVDGRGGETDAAGAAAPADANGIETSAATAIAAGAAALGLLAGVIGAVFAMGRRGQPGAAL